MSETEWDAEAQEADLEARWVAKCAEIERLSKKLAEFEAIIERLRSQAKAADIILIAFGDMLQAAKGRELARAIGEQLKRSVSEESDT